MNRSEKSYELYKALKVTLCEEQVKTLVALDDDYTTSVIENYELGLKDGIKQGIKMALQSLLDLM